MSRNSLRPLSGIAGILLFLFRGGAGLPGNHACPQHALGLEIPWAARAGSRQPAGGHPAGFPGPDHDHDGPCTCFGACTAGPGEPLPPTPPPQIAIAPAHTEALASVRPGPLPRFRPPRLQPPANAPPRQT